MEDLYLRKSKETGGEPQDGESAVEQEGERRGVEVEGGQQATSAHLEDATTPTSAPAPQLPGSSAEIGNGVPTPAAEEAAKSMNEGLSAAPIPLQKAVQSAPSIPVSAPLVTQQTVAPAAPSISTNTLGPKPAQPIASLAKRLVPTYKGRTLREDNTEDIPKFFDDAAVFVSQLVKAQESEITLFQRFSRYGQVVSLTSAALSCR